MSFIEEKELQTHTNRFVLSLGMISCLKARVRFGLNGLKTVISMLAIVNIAVTLSRLKLRFITII